LIVAMSLTSSEAYMLQFNDKEEEMLREVVKFLNDHYATQNFLRFGNQPSPDFNKGRLTVEEEKAFWEKLGI
jgi:hypothetical protein